MTKHLPPLPNGFKIVSGGQTGVDRAALDAAIEAGIAHGGWCPRGRLAEDGALDDSYALVETASSKYPVRTEQNVVDSDGTLILFVARLQGGTLLTLRLTKKHSKPILLCDFEEQTSIDEMRQWIAEHDIRVLNVAGPRESTSPGIYTKAKSLIKRIIE